MFVLLRKVCDVWEWLNCMNACVYNKLIVRLEIVMPLLKTKGTAQIFQKSRPGDQVVANLQEVTAARLPLQTFDNLQCQGVASGVSAIWR